MKNVNRDAGGRWLKGTSPPNPTGRPLSARSKISEKLLADLADVWEEHGVGVLQRLAVTDPGKLAQIAYGLLPRDVFISVEQRTPGNLDPDEWAILRRVIDLIQQNAPGAEPCVGQRICWPISRNYGARALQKRVEVYR